MAITKLDTSGLHPSSTFNSGEGISDYYINCSADPYNLCTPSDLIVGRALQMRTELPENQPLVILIGEDHATASHYALQQMVAAQLLEQGQKFTFNFEYSSNGHICGINKKAELYTPLSIYDDYSHYDEKGKIALSSYLGFLEPSLAPASTLNLMAFCYHNDVTCIFNDACRLANDNNNYYLDLNDAFTTAIAQKYNPYKKAFNAAKPDGMAIRNMVMARKGLAAAQKKKINLLIQKVGSAHLFGQHPVTEDKDDNLFCYQDSLCAAYRKAGAAVLPVYLSMPRHGLGINILPEDAYETLKQSVIINGLADDEFFDPLFAKYNKIPFRFETEEDFLRNKLNKGSSGKLQCFDVPENREEYFIRARQHARELERAYFEDQAANKNKSGQEKPPTALSRGGSPKL